MKKLFSILPQFWLMVPRLLVAGLPLSAGSCDRLRIRLGSNTSALSRHDLVFPVRLALAI